MDDVVLSFLLTSDSLEMDPVESSLGALHIASGISAFFLGCLVLQAYRYFSDYPRDSRWIKSLIALMLLSELALHMTMTEVSYIMSIIHAGDPQVFSHISTSQLAPPLFLSVFAIPMNEIFYYWRIYRLLNWKWPSIIATVLSCCRTCGWIYYLSHATRLGLTALIADTSLRWLVILLFTFTIALNSCIVLVMTAYLSQHRKTPIMATRKLVERLIMWTVSTSMIAMIPQMLSFILFVTMKESLIWMCMVPIYTKVFANCLLSTLNNRPVTTKAVDLRASPGTAEIGKEIDSLTSATAPRFATISIAPACASPSALSANDISSYIRN
ncbi:hypothetical protein AB1N83_011421 [Pleurotus pulmonarius]